MTKTEAQTHLLNTLKPKQTVYTMLTHVSKSGMKRCIQLFIASIDSEGKPEIRDITYFAHLATGYRVDQKHGGLVLNGCGMDMGFQAVYALGAYLWPEGTPEPHGTRDGGYALKQSWL
jgi:hypothetical protein